MAQRNRNIFEVRGKASALAGFLILTQLLAACGGGGNVKPTETTKKMSVLVDPDHPCAKEQNDLLEAKRELDAHPKEKAGFFSALGDKFTSMGIGSLPGGTMVQKSAGATKEVLTNSAEENQIMQEQLTGKRATVFDLEKCYTKNGLDRSGNPISR